MVKEFLYSILNIIVIIKDEILISLMKKKPLIFLHNFSDVDISTLKLFASCNYFAILSKFILFKASRKQFIKASCGVFKSVLATIYVQREVLFQRKANC